MILRYSPTGVGPYGGDYPDERPRTRGECMDMARPCPFVSCRYHLAIDAHRDRHNNHTLRILNEDPATMANTCALDVADGLCDLPDQEGVAHEPHEEAAHTTMREIAGLMGDVLTVERVRQTIETVQKQMRRSCAQELEDYEIDARESDAAPRTDLRKAESVILRELSSGPKHLRQLVTACGEVDVGRSTTKHALRNIKARTSQIISTGRGGRRQGIWSLVGGKANPRHPGHAGKARGTD